MRRERTGGAAIASVCAEERAFREAPDSAGVLQTGIILRIVVKPALMNLADPTSGVNYLLSQAEEEHNV